MSLSDSSDSFFASTFSPAGAAVVDGAGPPAEAGPPAPVADEAQLTLCCCNEATDLTAWRDRHLIIMQDEG